MSVCAGGRGTQIEMKAHLVRQVLLVLIAMEEVAQPPPQFMHVWLLT